MAKVKYTSSSLKRQLATYAKPRTFMMFEAERDTLMRGKSEHLSRVLDQYYILLTPSHQSHLLELYNKKHSKK